MFPFQFAIIFKYFTDVTIVIISAIIVIIIETPYATKMDTIK